jgi:hypothetical protein
LEEWMARGKTTILLAIYAGLACGQTGLTTIQDTLFKADGTLFNGSMTIQWSTFDANNIGTIVQQSESVPVVNGNLYLQLVPNATAAPPANVYTVQYQSDGREQFAETWTVPVSTVPLRVAQVRVGSQAITTTGGGTSSTSNSAPIPESSVIGLQSDLAIRPTMGVGYGTNAVAIVDDNGNLETAIGDPGNCVFIDGTTGPCGQPTYSDAEVPGGTLDGMNNTFTLANTPLGSSLALFRNGVYLTANSDYTLNGTTIQFVAGALPQPGDTLIANYRVDTSAGGNITALTAPGGAIHTGAPQVICSGAGRSTNATGWTTLAGCDIPAAGLQTGDRIEVRFTLTHSGSTTGFSFQVNWGNTTILSRTAGTQDAAVAGQADAAISATGAQLSLESWGTVLPFLPGLATAPAQSGLEVSFLGAMTTAGSESVSLTNYTVLRYPAN